MAKILVLWSPIFLIGLFFAGSLAMLGSYNVSMKYTIENVCTESLGVRCTIGELHINEEQRTVRLGHVQIFNPKKFSDGAAVEIENIDVTLDTASRGLIRVSEITASGTQVNLEVLRTKNNLSAITRKMESAKPVEVFSDTEKLKIMIDSLTVHENRIRPRTLINMRGRKIVALPGMQLTQVGYHQRGLLLKDAITQIWNQIVPEFQTAAANAGFLAGMTEESYGDILDEGQDTANDALISE